MVGGWHPINMKWKIIQPCLKPPTSIYIYINTIYIYAGLPVDLPIKKWFLVSITHRFEQSVSCMPCHPFPSGGSGQSGGNHNHVNPWHRGRSAEKTHPSHWNRHGSHGFRKWMKMAWRRNSYHGLKVRFFMHSTQAEGELRKLCSTSIPTLVWIRHEAFLLLNSLSIPNLNP